MVGGYHSEWMVDGSADYETVPNYLLQCDQQRTGGSGHSHSGIKGSESRLVTASRLSQLGL